MRQGLRTAALALLAALLPACEGHILVGPPFPSTLVSALLRGSQVVPAQGSAATGTATVTVDGELMFFDYSIAQTGIGTVTAVEIRLGIPGTNGPVLFTIPLTAFPLSGRVSDTGVFPPVGTVTSFSEACAAIAAGNTYLLISSVAQPSGEIRGHLGPATLASVTLRGGQESPPLAVTGTGNAQVSLDDAQAQLTVTLSVSGLTGISGAQIFDGAPGVNGSGPLFILSATAFSSPLVVNLTSLDFTASATITTFTDAVNALLSGGLYVQVPTTGNPSGEIRGQIGPTQLTAALNGGNVVPSNTSTATGSATLVLSATQSAFFITLTHTVSAADRSGLHVEVPGNNGPMIFDLAAIAGAATSPLVTTVTPSRLIPYSPENIQTFPDAVNAILIGRSYVDVGSPSFPNGEIRGQILP
jgi:hypothetical protein